MAENNWLTRRQAGSGSDVTSMPAKAQLNFFNKMPDASMATKGVRTHAGTGWTTNDMITFPSVVRVWAETNYQEQIFESQFLFTLRDSPNKIDRLTITLRQVNEIFRIRYMQADRIFREGLITGIEGAFSKEQMQELWNLPTVAWENYPGMQQALNSKTNDARMFAFLFENKLEDMWNFYGIAKGQISPPSAEVKQLTVGRGGVIETVEGVFGDGAIPSYDIHFILRRVEDAKGRWGPFAFVPYTGPYRPSMKSIEYRDYSGNVCHGKIIYVGKVLHLDTMQSSDSNLMEDVGLRLPRQNRLFTKARDEQIKIVMGTPPGRRVPFYL